MLSDDIRVPESENRNYIGGYFDWLCELINVDDSVYGELIQILYIVPFKWVIELDINRNRDGLLLREEFAEFYPDGIGVVGDTASVLEVLIGLARQMDFILDDEDQGDRTRVWFWEFVKNLGLDIYTNAYIETASEYGYKGNDTVHLFDSCSNRITKICDVWLNRDFGYSGVGSPFPLTNPLSDQRKLDMIRQLNAYVMETHMYEDELL